MTEASDKNIESLLELIRKKIHSNPELFDTLQNILQEQQSKKPSLTNHSISLSDYRRLRHFHNLIAVSEEIPFSILLTALSFNSTEQLISWLSQFNIPYYTIDHSSKLIQVTDQDSLYEKTVSLLNQYAPQIKKTRSQLGWKSKVKN